MRSPKVSKKAKCPLDLDLDLDLDQQHMLTSLAAGKKHEITVNDIEVVTGLQISNLESRVTYIFDFNPSLKVQ